MRQKAIKKTIQQTKNWKIKITLRKNYNQKENYMTKNFKVIEYIGIYQNICFNFSFFFFFRLTHNISTDEKK